MGRNSKAPDNPSMWIKERLEAAGWGVEGPRAVLGSRAWVIVACAIFAVGSAASLASALLWRSSVRKDQHQAFQTAATEVSDTAQTLLRRDTDFLGTLNTVLTMQPHLTQGAFSQWYTELEGWQRQVGGLGTVVANSVPAGHLKAFLSRRNAEPAFGVELGKVLPVAVDGRRRYCLVSAGESVIGPLSPHMAREVQGYWCQSSSATGRTSASRQRLAAESGALLAFPISVAGLHTLFLERAFYRRGASLSTIAQRRAAVNGWVLGTFDIATLLNTALGGHAGLGISLYHANAGRGSELVGHGGPRSAAKAYSLTSTADIEGPWTTNVQGAVATGGVSATAQGLIVFAAGVLVSLLLAALVLVLTRSRKRALEEVEEKTGQLRHQSLHDALTGLPNRILAVDRTEQLLARARRQDTPVAALFVDIDRFRVVNDTFGSAIGDELLGIAAKRLTDVVREGETAARVLGDKFLVLVEGSTLDAGPELVAERILDVLRQPYDLNGTFDHRVSLTASVGIAVGAGATTADELLRHADLALHDAKGSGRNCYAMFEPGMKTASQDRLMLEMDLAEALGEKQLFLLYQPTFDLRKEEIVGVEALLRWQHPTRGMIPPDQFIPIAEQSGLIVPIGRWVLKAACGQAASWHRQGQKLGMAVNVSARQLDDDEFIEDVRRALAETGLAPEALTLEITETALMRDTALTAKRLSLLKALGVRIAIDDFGTGYSSLAYLKQFTADTLKIDRSFISSIATSRASAALVQTLVQLGKALDLEIVAEGIENMAQLKALQQQDCDQGQGFLLSRPLHAQGVEEFINAPGALAPCTG